MKDLGCFVYMYIRNFAFSLQVYWESFFSYMLAPDHILLLTLKTLMKLCIHIQLEKQSIIQEVLLYSSVEESAPRVFRSCRNSTCSSVCFALYNTQRTSTVFYLCKTLFQVTYYMLCKTFLIYYIELWDVLLYYKKRRVLSLAIKRR